MPTLTVQSNRDTFTGWRYFWCKTVEGFDPSQHCARCLKGSYSKAIGLHLRTNKPVLLSYTPGTVLYFCGVSTPYLWEKNFHLPVRVKEGAMATANMHTGDRLVIEGAEELSFDDIIARRTYPDLSEAFLTCRNYQFGAHYYSDHKNE
jgi:hypothetical protein